MNKQTCVFVAAVVIAMGAFPGTPILVGADTKTADTNADAEATDAKRQAAAFPSEASRLISYRMSDLEEWGTEWVGLVKALRDKQISPAHDKDIETSTNLMNVQREWCQKLRHIADLLQIRDAVVLEKSSTDKIKELMESVIRRRAAEGVEQIDTSIDEVKQYKGILRTPVLIASATSLNHALQEIKDQLKWLERGERDESQ